MPQADCESHVLIQGTRIRGTRIDECGAPAGGVDGAVVTKGFAEVSMTDNVESPDEFKPKNAQGEFEATERSRPQLNWIETVVSLTRVSPPFFEMLTGSRLIYDDSDIPMPIGFATDTDTYASASFALEVWTNIAKSQGAACGVGGRRYGYLLLPWLLEGTIGDFTIANAEISFTITSITSSGSDWGVGPYDVLVDRNGLPSPLLEPIPPTRHRALMFTSLAPPEPVCGYQELVLAS